MTFASPIVLAALAVLLPIIVALHTLRREEHATASLFLWSKVPSRRRGSRKRRSVPWTDPLLWLHLAIATFGVVALAGPRIGGAARVDHVVFVIDGSRTMRTADVAPTRYGAAVEWAIASSDASDPNAMLSFIVVSDEARLLAARRGPDAELAEQLRDSRAEDTTPAWHEALALVRSLQVPGESQRIVLLSDGATDDAIDAALEAPYAGAGLQVERPTWGGPVVNVAVADVDVRPRGTGENRWTVRGEVRSDGLQRGDVVRVQILFRPADSETSLPWTGTDVPVERDGSGAFELPIDLPGDGILEVRTNGQDQRPSDDVARRVLRADAATTRIAVVGPEDPALLAALRAIGRLQVARFEQLPEGEGIGAFDLVVATGPLERPVPTSVLWYGAPPPPFVVASGSLDGTPVTAAPGHPLMQEVDAGELGITAARVLDVPPGADPLITADGAVLAWSRTSDVGRQVAFGFGPDESAWAAQLSFPVFVASLVEWSRSTPPSGASFCLAGEPCPLPAVAYEGDWDLVDAAGTVVASAPELVAAPDDQASATWPSGAFDRAFVPGRAGLYQLRRANGTARWIAVDAPPTFDAGSASTVGAPGRSAPADPRPAVRPWRWLAAAATALILVDALLAWRSARNSLSARSKRGRASALTSLAILLAAGLFGLAASTLVPTLRAATAGTHVVFRPAAAPDEAAGSSVSRLADRWLGWRGVDVVVGASSQEASDGAERPGRSDAPTAPNLERGIDLAFGLHAGRGPLLLDARAMPTSGLPAGDAAALSSHAETSEGSVALWAPDPRGGDGNGADATGFRRVEVPVVPRAGGAFDLVVRFAPSDVPTVLEVFDADGERVDAHPVPPGVAQVRRSLPAGEAGWSTYRIRLRTEGDDASGAAVGGAIDEVPVAVNVAPPLRALVVASSEDAGGLLVAALEAQRIEVDRVAGDRIPATLERLLAYDLVVLVDVPASEIHPFHQEMLQTFVRDEGGGLVIVGGGRSFGPGGYYSTVLDDVSPLSSRIEEDTPEVAMTFVLDRSGSMNAAEGDATRLDLAKLATFEAIRLLGERSQAALVAFDTVATTLLPLQSTAGLDPFRSALQTVVAGGGTSIYPALVQAYEVVAASDSATRHVIVLTDGLSEEGDFEEILARIGALGVDTSFVGVGDAASRGQLTRLAGLGGGSLHFTNDARALPGILAQEALMLSADPIEERATDPVWVEGEPPAFLGDEADVAVAPLLGYVRTTAKDEATVLLEDATSQDPLLATWRYGLGRVASFATEADGPWSGTWTQQDDFATFWSQLARWSASTVPADAYRFETTVHEATVDVVLDVAPGTELRDPPVAQLVRADSDEVVAASVLQRERAGRWFGRLALSSEDGQAYLIRVSTGADGILEEPIERAFVHQRVSWSDGSAIDVVPLASVERGLARGSGGVEDTRFANGRRPFVAPDLAWRGSPRWWLLAAVTAFMIALGMRFGGIPLRFGRRAA